MSSYCKIMDQARLTSGGPTITVPKFVGKTGVGGERVREGKKVLLEIDRAHDGASAAIEGTIAVWGVNLPSAHAGLTTAAECQVFKAADAGTQTNFDCTSDIAYAAQSNYNNIVIQDGTVLEAGAGAGKYTVANNGGALRVTLGSAAPAGSRVEVYRVTPVAIKADGANALVRDEVTSKRLIWVNATHDGVSSDLSATIVGIRALN